jgi:hypothetical protein
MAVPCWSSWKTGTFIRSRRRRSIYVLEVDAAEGGLQGGDHVDETVDVRGVDLQVEDVDSGELLEQHRLAFHHRLGGGGADGAQPQHGGAVGDDRHQVGPGGQLVGARLVLDDRLAGGGDAGRIGERQVALAGQRLGGLHRQLPRPGKLVIGEGGAAERVIHGSVDQKRTGAARRGEPAPVRPAHTASSGSGKRSIGPRPCN